MSNNFIDVVSFHNQEVSTINRNNQIWLTSTELAKLLRYADTKSVTKIYSRNSDEFTSKMTMVVKLTTNGINNSLRQKSVRIFSLRGAHLIAMFSNTDVAKEVRKWLLDLADKEVGTENKKPIALEIPHEGRWVVRVIGNNITVKEIGNKVIIDRVNYQQLQRDSVFYRNQLDNINKQLSNFLKLTVDYTERTRITTGESSVTLFNQPLASLLG